MVGKVFRLFTFNYIYTEILFALLPKFRLTRTGGYGIIVKNDYAGGMDMPTTFDARAAIGAEIRTPVEIRLQSAAAYGMGNPG